MSHFFIKAAPAGFFCNSHHSVYDQVDIVRISASQSNSNCTILLLALWLWMAYERHPDGSRQGQLQSRTH